MKQNIPLKNAAVNIALIIASFGCMLIYSQAAFAQGADASNDPQLKLPKETPSDFEGTPREASKACRDFFKQLIAGNPDNAFDKLLNASPLGNKKEQSAKRVATFNKAVEMYGAARGYEFAGVDRVSESLLKIRFITLHEQYPLRWFFTFYKSPANGWTVINMVFDDDIEYLFPKY